MFNTNSVHSGSTIEINTWAIGPFKFIGLNGFLKVLFLMSRNYRLSMHELCWFWYQSSFTHWFNYMVDRYTKEKNNGFFSGGIWLQSFCFWLFLFYSDKLVFVLLSCLVAQLIDICSWNFHVGEEQLCRTCIHTGTQKNP